MGMRDNYLYGNPYADRVTRNLGTIVFGNPGAQRRREVAEAQIRNYDARTREVERKAEEQRAEGEAIANIGNVLRNALFEEAAGPPTADGQAPLSSVKRAPADIERRLPDALASSAAAYRGKPGAMGDVFRVIGALSGDDSLARRGMVAAGNNPTQYFALTPERADAISDRDSKEQERRELAVEGVRETGRNSRFKDREKRLGEEFTLREKRLKEQEEARETGRGERSSGRNEALLEREGVREEGRNSRANNAEIGRQNRFDARESRLGDEFTRAEEGRNNRVAAQQEGANQRSADANQTRRDIATELEAGRNDRHDRPRAVTPRPEPVRPPPRLLPKDAAALEDLAFAAIGGTPSMKDAALAKMTADDRAGLNAAIADEWARSNGNAAATAAAGGKYLDGILKLNKNEVSGIGSVFNVFRRPSLDRRPAEAPSMAPAPAAIPPPAQREVGRVYDTPRGPMIWMGAGWKPAGA